MATQEGRPLGNLAGLGYLAPTKKSSISSDSPAQKNITRVNTKVAPDQLQTPVAVFNRFSPLYGVEVFNETSVHDTRNDNDYEFSDLEGDLGILELNSENTVNDTNYDDLDKLLLKKRVDQYLVQQARSCLEFVACKPQMDNAFGIIPLSPLMGHCPKTNNVATSDILALHRTVKDSYCLTYLGVRIPGSSKLKIGNIIWLIIGINNLWTYWNLASLSILTEISN